MARITQQAQATITAKSEIKLAPALRTKLQNRLRVFADVKAKFDAAKAALDREKRVLGGLREQTGEQSLTLDGYGTITEVRGTSKKLDKKLFVAIGGSLAQLEEATVTTPKRPYDLITLPGDERDDDE